MSWLVLGLARSGQAAALALRRRGEEVIGVDASPSLDVGRLAESGVEIHLGTEEERLLDGVETLVKSPGVPGEAPLVQAARARGIPVWSEVELGSRLLGTPIVGVTGTNGKTTTSELLGADAGRSRGRKRRSRPQRPRRQDRAGQVVVCEVSSFQLEDIHEFRPRVAVLLNLEPDHLDRHGSIDAYRAAKLRIFENQQETDVAVVPRGFDDVPGHARRIEFEPADELPVEPLIPGAHNRENAAAATVAARALGPRTPGSRRRSRPSRGRAPARARRRDRRRPLRERLEGDEHRSRAPGRGRLRRAASRHPGRSRQGGELHGARPGMVGRARRAYLIGEAAGDIAPALELAGVDTS